MGIFRPSQPSFFSIQPFSFPSSLTHTPQMEQVCKDACSLLDLFTSEKIVDKGSSEVELRLGRLLEESRGLVFLWSVSAGLGVGLQKGSGFYIDYQGGKWSAPVFVSSTVGQAGLVVGVEKVSTLMVAFTRRFADQLRTGRVLDGDVTMQIQPLQSIQGTYEASTSFWGTTDVLHLSASSGLMANWSFSGGAITVDEARNAEYYGKSANVEGILSGQVPRPDELLPLYQKIVSIIKDGQGHGRAA